MGWPLAIAGIAAAGASMVGSSAAANAANAASDRAAEVAAQIHALDYKFQKDMYADARTDLAPWQQGGLEGMGNLMGGEWTPNQDEGGTYSWQDKEGGGPDYDSGARNALNSYAALDPSKGMPDANMGMNLDPMAGQPDTKLGLEDPRNFTIDPATGMPIGPNLPDSINMNFDPNDEVYKWKMAEAEKGVNKAMAARGMHDSSAAVNQLSKAGMQVTADEIDKQYGRAVDEYGREYGKGMDIYGTGMDRATNIRDFGANQIRTCLIIL